MEGLGSGEEDEEFGSEEEGLVEVELEEMEEDRRGVRVASVRWRARVG